MSKETKAQQACEYCHNVKAGLHGKETAPITRGEVDGQVMLYEDGAYLQISDYLGNYSNPDIHYCPMCGRKLD